MKISPINVAKTTISFKNKTNLNNTMNKTTPNCDNSRLKHCGADTTQFQKNLKPKKGFFTKLASFLKGFTTPSSKTTEILSSAEIADLIMSRAYIL